MLLRWPYRLGSGDYLLNCRGIGLLLTYDPVTKCLVVTDPTVMDNCSFRDSFVKRLGQVMDVSAIEMQIIIIINDTL